MAKYTISHSHHGNESDLKWRLQMRALKNKITHFGNGVYPVNDQVLDQMVSFQ